MTLIRVLRWLSAAALLFNVVGGLIDLSVWSATTIAQQSAPTVIEEDLIQFVWTSAPALVLSANVVGLVAAGQRRQRGWFAGMLLCTLARVYDSFVFSLFPPPVTNVHFGATTGQVPPQGLVMDGLSILAAVVTLLYSWRPRTRASVPDLEYSSIDQSVKDR